MRVDLVYQCRKCSARWRRGVSTRKVIALDMLISAICLGCQEDAPADAALKEVDKA